jgi:hypothetical protein
LETNRPKIVNAMKAVMEGYFTLKKDKPLALQLIKKYSRVSDEDASLGYDYYLAKYGEGVMVLPERKGLRVYYLSGGLHECQSQRTDAGEPAAVGWKCSG